LIAKVLKDELINQGHGNWNITPEIVADMLTNRKPKGDTII